MATFVRTQAIEHAVGQTGTVSLDITEGDIQARGVPGNEARIRATFAIRASSDAEADRIFEEVQLRVTRGRGELAVSDPNRGTSIGSIVSRLFGGGHADLTVEAQVPSGARLEVVSVSADADVSGTHGDQRYRTVSGDLRLRDVGGPIRLEAVSGDATIRADAPVAIRAQAVSGDISVIGRVLRSVVATSVSGDVELEGELERNGEFRVETVSGDLAVGLVGAATFEVHGIATDVSSDLDHRLEGQVDRRRLIVGSGGPRFVFSSMSGDVSVRRPRRLSATEPRPPAPPVPPVPPVPSAPPDPARELEVLRALERGEISVDEASRRLAGGA